MYRTDCVILKRIDIGEHDALFMLYTKEFGKIRAFARGIKKPEAKLRGHLEPLSMSVIQFVMSRNGERLTHASLLHAWPQIREDIEKLSLAWHLTTLIDRSCLEGERDEPLWDLLVHTFINLESGDSIQGGYSHFLRSFEIKLLERLGYGGETNLRVLF